MNPTSSGRGLLRARSSILVSSAVAVALGLTAGVVPAQTSPYQSSQRNDFGSGLGQEQLPKGGSFQPRVEAAAQYANNINLAEDSRDQIDTFGLEVAPGFYASYLSESTIAAIDYSLIGRGWDDSDFNDVSHRLEANGEWRAIPEWFSLLGQASYSDSVVDAAQGANYGGLGIFGPGNLAEVASMSVTPRFSHRFGDFQADAHYSYGRTWYLDEGKGQPPQFGFVGDQDSEDQDASVSVGTSRDAGSKLTGRAFYDWQKSEFENALPYEYERAGADLGFKLSRTVSLVGDVGRESALDEDSTAGGLDSDFWSAGLRYDPNERTTLEGRYGERFFGDSWSASVQHRARLIDVTAAYSEQPEVETRQLSLGEFDPGTLPPGFPTEGFALLASEPYVAKTARVTVDAEGSRTKIGFVAYHQDRDYLTGLRDDEINAGAALTMTRDLASNLSADVELTYGDFERTLANPTTVDATSYQDTTLLVRANKEAGKRFVLSGETGYLTRSGDADYDGWWVALRARWTP
jgi:hypothetical protein